MRLGNLLRDVLSLMLGAKLPRPMQVEAWNKWKNKTRHRMLPASQGWGKSYMIKMVALHEQMFEKGRRSLIVAPTKNIGGGYRADKAWVLSRDWVGAVYFLTVAVAAVVSLWLVIPTLFFGLPVWRRYSTHTLEIVNLCDCDSSNTISQVKEFFLGGKGTMVCCGASASRAWRELKDEHGDDLRGLVRNISPWLDEIHFAKAGEHRRNRLGDMLFDLMRCDESVWTGGMSATPFREDGPLFHPDDVVKFKEGEYKCDFGRHFEENMMSVKYMDYYYIAYDGIGGWQDELTKFVREKGNRMLVYIPAVNSLASNGKHNDYAMAEAAIQKVYPDANIVNLVDDSMNAERLEVLRQDIRKGNNPEFVIALRMMMVGSDWPDLRSIFDLSPSASLSTDGQKCGRLHREGKDKETISHCTAFMKFGRDDIENIRVQCTDRLNALISVLLMRYIFLGEPMFRSEGRGGSGRNGQPRGNPAMDWPELHRFIRIVYSRLHVGTEIADCILVAREVMDEMDVPEELRLGLEDIVRNLEGRRLSRRTAEAMRLNGSDPVGPVGIGELTSGMVLQFKTGPRDKGLLSDFQKAAGIIIRTPEEWVVIAEKMAEENGGTLQSPGWLQANGLTGMSAVMSKRPELFAHIKQYRKKGRTPEEWVSVAEKIAEENGGTLQNTQWLVDNGHRGVYKAMCKRPELFAHIKQEKRYCTSEEWVSVAEKMAEENGGTLQSPGWLQTNGRAAMYNAMNKRPELFAHIKQKKRGRRPRLEEWVPVAEKMAEENGGVLQNPKWLRDNGQGRLSDAMSRRPELFAHIKQNKKRRKNHTLEEWVSVAEKMAEENGGVLQNPKWLRDNGHRGMLDAMYKRPELFAHIKQSRKQSGPSTNTR